MILLALAIIALGCLGFVLGSGLSAYFAPRFTMGLGSGGLWIGITFDTLRRWPGQEYLCMSRIFTAYSAGGLIGPALGAINGVHGPFLAYGALVVAALALVALLPTPSASRVFASDRSALGLPGFWAACRGDPLHRPRTRHRRGRAAPAPLQPARTGRARRDLRRRPLLVAGSAALAARFHPRSDVLAAAALITAGLALAGATDAIHCGSSRSCSPASVSALATPARSACCSKSVQPERIVTAMIVWSQIGIAGYLRRPVAAGAVAESARLRRPRPRTARRRTHAPRRSAMGVDFPTRFPTALEAPTLSLQIGIARLRLGTS